LLTDDEYFLEKVEIENDSSTLDNFLGDNVLVHYYKKFIK